MKYRPRITVRIRDWIASFRFPSMMLWWAQVTVTPEARRTAVFNSGTSNGSRAMTPVGGHTPPSSGVGARLEW